MFPKREAIRSSGYTRAARGRPCSMESPWCNHDPETTVFAHSNFAEDGKGIAQKADDLFGADLCSECHRWLDEGRASRETKRDTFHRAMKRTMRARWEQGLLKIGGS
jgi:hypothetical protein